MSFCQHSFPATKSDHFSKLLTQGPLKVPLSSVLSSNQVTGTTELEQKVMRLFQRQLLTELCTTAMKYSLTEAFQ